MKSKEIIDSSVDSGDEPTPGIITETVGSYTDEAGNKVMKERVQLKFKPFFLRCGFVQLVASRTTGHP